MFQQHILILCNAFIHCFLIYCYCEPPWPSKGLWSWLEKMIMFHLSSLSDRGVFCARHTEAEQLLWFRLHGECPSREQSIWSREKNSKRRRKSKLPLGVFYLAKTTLAILIVLSDLKQNRAIWTKLRRKSQVSQSHCLTILEPLNERRWRIRACS